MHIPVWGTYVTTPYIGKDYAIVNIKTKVENIENGYHRFFNIDSGNGLIWAERDMINMLHHFPSKLGATILHDDHQSSSYDTEFCLWSNIPDDDFVAAEKVVRTAGKAAALKLAPDRMVLKADGEDLCFVNVSLVDKDGTPVPVDSRLVSVKVTGSGSFKAIANGDPTCLEPFQKSQMHLFSGQLTVLVQAGSEPGPITVEVSGKGVKKGIIQIFSE